MDSEFFLKGVVLGFSIAAPVGPIGVLCIRRTLAQGMASGFVSGLGAATADACYGTVAALGLSLITNILLEQAFYLQAIGGLFLLYLGYGTLRAKPAEEAAKSEGGSLIKDYASTLFLTVTNPLTILSFVAVFAGLGAGISGAGQAAAILLVGGVFSGSALWWLILSSFVQLFQKKLNYQGLIWVNRFSGMIILLFGGSALASLFN